MKRRRVFLRDWLARLQASGRYTFTREEALREGGAGERKSLWRAQRAGQLVQPRRGFYVIVPAEYKTAGAPPAPWFIDALMRAQKQAYYVGLLSAAALYGASAQAAQEFQVIAPRALRPVTVGRLRIRFVMRAEIHKAATVERQTPSGRMRVATPEQTALDLVTYPHASGGWDNVASIIREIAPQLDKTKLRRLVDTQANTRPVQRLGYLLELAGAEEPARALALWLRPRARGYTRFEPRGASDDAPRNERWHLVVNRRFELE